MEDVVWRADTGQYHDRASGVPVLMPPTAGPPAPAASTTPPPCGCGTWLGSAEATNILLLLILLALVFRGD